MIAPRSVTAPTGHHRKPFAPVAATPARSTFHRMERLRGEKNFAALIADGKAVNEAPFRLIGKILEKKASDKDAIVRIGFAVPKKHIPLAVGRNRVKRLLRESWRVNKERWIEQVRQRGVRCHWLIVFQGRQPVSLAETERKTSRLFERWLRDRDTELRPAR